MSEEQEEKTAPFDAELEIVKLQGRFRWIANELEELKQKDRSLSARISRLRLAKIEEEDEDLEGDPPETRASKSVDDLTIEERALLVSRLLDERA